MFPQDTITPSALSDLLIVIDACIACSCAIVKPETGIVPRLPRVTMPRSRRIGAFEPHLPLRKCEGSSTVGCSFATVPEMTIWGPIGRAIPRPDCPAPPTALRLTNTGAKLSPFVPAGAEIVDARRSDATIARDESTLLMDEPQWRWGGTGRSRAF